MNMQPISIKTILTAAAMAATLVLASCGGSGGGDDDEEEEEEPPVETPFEVTSVNPEDEAELESFPTSITLTFNRDLLLTSVSDSQFELSASGGDGTFGDGNETAIALSASASSSTVTISIDSAVADAAADDDYQLVANGDSADGIADLDGEIVDGDENGAEGGDFVSTFSFEAPIDPPPVVATLTQVQQEIFTPNCATSGCHAGASPARGMNLSDGLAFANIVNVASGQQGTLNRITPNDAENSYLIQKVEGTAASGVRMPAGGAPALSSEQIQLIRDWVSAGALDN